MRAFGTDTCNVNDLRWDMTRQSNKRSRKVQDERWEFIISDFSQTKLYLYIERILTMGGRVRILIP